MLADVTTLLTKPEAFFEQRGEDVSVKGPLLTVAAVSVVGILGALVSFAIQVIRLPGSVAAVLAIGAVFALIIRAVIPVIVWLVYSGFFLVITALLNGEGEPRDTILLAGWGMAPRVIGVLVVSAAALGANLLTPVPAAEESIRAYSQQVSQHPLNLVSPLFKLLVFLWSGYIWVYAVRRARSVSLKGAAIAVGIPVTIEIVVTLGLLGLALLGAAASP